MFTEINIDALVGPTHHFGGLGVGNVASIEHKDRVSYPKAAALEGLEKAKIVASLGVPQYLWLPPRRPRFDFLSQLGFAGEPAKQFEEAVRQAPQALSAAFSSAFMWAANSATVAPACDTQDGKLHFTPANLVSSWHRGFEAVERTVDLNTMFADLPNAVVHEPLPPIFPLRDEGAANHMRLCDPTGQVGFHVFVYGDDGHQARNTGSFIARHTRATCEATARLHGIDPRRVYLLQQHPEAIAAGVFHNDVIATSHYSLLLQHELAFLNSEAELDRLERDFNTITGSPLQRRVITNAELPLEQAVRSYLFNSQIVGCGTEAFSLVAPRQCESILAAKASIDALVTDSECPIREVHFVDLSQSMANGGGPACLRLRVLLDDAMLSKLRALRLNDETYQELRFLIETHYPDELSIPGLCQPEALSKIDGTYRAFESFCSWSF